MAKAPTQIKSLARSHTEAAINVLSGIMNQTEAPPAARVQAAQALLDRGWGKPTQPIAGDDDADPVTVRQIITGVPRATDEASPPQGWSPREVNDAVRTAMLPCPICGIGPDEPCRASGRCGRWGIGTHDNA